MVFGSKETKFLIETRDTVTWMMTSAFFWSKYFYL